MKEIKNIDQLFKAAKEEKPQVSFEEITSRFKVSVMQSDISSNPPTLFSKIFNLNSLLLITAITLLSIVGYWLSKPIVVSINEDNIPLIISEQAVIAPIEKEDSKSSFKNPSTNKEVPLITPISSPNEQQNKVSSSHENPFNKSLDLNKNVANKIVIKTTISTKNQPKVAAHQATTPVAESKKNDLITNTIQEETSNANNSKNKLTIDSKSTVTPKVEIINPKEQVLLLSKNDSQKQINSFINTIQSYGIQTDLYVNKIVKNNIRKLTLQMNHPQGLDWRIRLQDFDYLEIKILLDEQQQAYGITYRLNQNGDFAEYLTFKHKGRSLHKFAGKGTKSKHQHTRRLIQN